MLFSLFVFNALQGKRENVLVHSVYYSTEYRISCIKWLTGNALVSVNIVTLRRDQLMLGWVNVCGWVNHLGV